MGFTARRAESWRARSRAGIALVVLTAWFGTLMVASPTISGASASSTADPSFSTPPTHGTTNTPQFAFTANGVNDPVECGWADNPSSAPTLWAPCTSPYTPTLTDAEGTYDVWIRSVSTPVDSGLPDTPTVGFDPTPVPSDGVSTTYVIDRTDPVVTLAQSPPATGPTSTVGWEFTANEPATVTCVLSGTSAAGPAACGPGTVFPGGPLADGSYTITATATDLAGNTGTASTTYSQDTTGPVLTLAAGPTGRGNDTTPDWQVTADGGEAVTCSVTLGGVAQPALDGPCSAGSYPATALTTDGTYVLSATSADALGNSTTTVMGTYVLDRSAPVLTVGATNASNPVRPSWTVAVTDDEAGVIAKCRLTGTGGVDTGLVNCGATYTAPTLAEGSYTLTVTATDTAGNNAVPEVRTYTYDVTAPGAPVLGGPSGYTRTDPIVWTVDKATGDTDTDHIVCVVTGPSGSPVTTDPCGATVTVSAPAEGLWTLTATAYDASGNNSGAATRSVTYDATAPTITVVAKSSPAKSPTWTVSVAASGETASCSMAGVFTATDCTNKDITADLTTKPGGVYNLVVDAVDLAGNTSSTSVRYVLAPDAPTVTVAAQGSSLNPTWTISAQSGATLTCELVAPGGAHTAVTPCATGTIAPTLTGGANGTWNLEVVATISTPPGTTSSPVGTSAGYLLDTVAPGDPTITGTPTRSQNTSTASWTITPAAGTTRVDCGIFHNGALVRTQPSCEVGGVSLTFGGASDEGSWQIKATAYDQVGNPSNVVSGPIVTYDITDPAVPNIVALPSPSNDSTPTWTINHEVGSSLECAWTTGAAVPSTWFACATPAVLSIPAPANDGVYILHARATDAAGNTGPADSQTYELDRTAPAAPTFSVPTSPSSSATVSWTLGTAGEINPTLECRLQLDDGSGTFATVAGRDWASCTSPYTQTLPTEGDYRAQSRVTDRAGNLGPTGTSTTYTYDKTPPRVPTVTGPTGPSQIRSVTWTITPASTDGGTGLQCRYVENGVALGSFITCGTSVSRTGLADGSYALEVRAVDDAGNVSTPTVTSPTYVVDNVGPAAPTFAGTDGTGNVTSTTWSFSGELGATASCLLYLDGVAVDPAPTTCSSGSTVALTDGDGAYRLEVFFVDAAGNPGVAAKSPTYLLDTLDPATPDLHGPTGTANTNTAQYVFTAETGTAAECRLLFVAAGSAGSPAPVGTGAWTSCSSPWNQTLALGDGRYQAEVHVTDAAGNVSPDAQSEVYALDTTGPLAPTFTAQPTGTDNVTAVTWTWSGETPSTGTCTLSLTPVGSTTAGVVAGPVACDSGTYSTTLTYGDGFYQLSVQLKDPQTNAGAVAVSTGYTLDATAPGTPTVSGPSGTSNDTTADYDITSSVETGAALECQLRRDTTTVVQAWGTCTMPRTITLVGDGSYVLDVRLTDQYGNLGAVGSSPAYLLDTGLPTVPAVTAPSSPSANASPSFTIGTDDDTTTTCRLTRGSVTAVDTTTCSGTFTPSLTGMPDGDYVLTVIATDPAGNTATGSSTEYIFDTTAPIAPVVTGPAGPSQTRIPTFSWSGEVGARAECSLKEEAGTPSSFTTCSTPYAPALPGDGSWVLSVRLVDAAGNVSVVGSSGAYLLDTTAPATPLVSAPTSPGRDLNPSWSASTEEGSTTECRLTGPGQLGTWGACTLPVATPLSADGVYTFEVRATDAARNVSPVGSGSYELDTTAPAAPVVTQPTSPGRFRTPSISFTSDPGTTGSCRLTRGSTVLADSAPCSSPATLDLNGLPDGAYTLSVRSVDNAGNIGPAATGTYVLDTTAPSAPTFTLVAGSPSSDQAPVFAFNAELGTTLGCRLTLPGGGVRDLACSSPLTLDLAGAPDGDYVLAVRATDPAGNIGPAATTTYHLDSTAPVAPHVVGPVSPGSNRAPVWKISSASPAECRLTRGTTIIRDWTPCATSYTADLFAQPDGAYVLEARVIGTTAPTSSRYRLDTTVPSGAVIVGPPSPGTSLKPTWAVSSADPTVRAECRVLVFTGVLRDWATCAVSSAGSLYTLDLTGLGDGTYTLVVRLTDAAGNLGPTSSSDYVLDRSAPAAVGVVGPLSPGNDTTPTWTLTSATGVKLECRLSSGQKVVSDFAPCTATFTADLTGLPDGTYTLTVHALSAAGTPGPETTSSYILDTTAAGAPGTLSGPTGPSRDRAPRWTFSLAPGTTAICKVTVGGKVFFDGPCTSPFVLDLSNAADGTYTLTVRAVDAAGNLGSPSTASYILKTTPPPPPVLTMTPGSPSSTTDPRWGFSLYRGTTAQCRLLQGGAALEDWTACSAPGDSTGTVTALLSGKPDGRYTMQVRAIDLALNTSAAVSGDYTLDRSAAPLAQFDSTPKTPGNDTTPTWTIGQPPAGTTECRLTTPRGAGGWTPCAGAYTATTNGDGTYLLEVRAFDSAGVRGPATSAAYQLDTRVPAAPRFIDPIPPVVGNDAQVAWSWADDELMQCRMLRNGSALGAFATCQPPYVFDIGRQGEATYSIEARAVDAAGNVSPVTVGSYRYDITPPSAPVFVSRPPSRGTASSVTWTFAVPLDASATCVVTRNGTVISESACAGSFTLDLRGQQPATWSLSVRFVDAAGNAGPSTVGSYTLTSLVGRSRVDSASGPGGSGFPSGSGPGDGSVAVPGGSGLPDIPGTGVDQVNDHPRAGAAVPRSLPEVIRKGTRAVARVTAAIPGAIPGTDVPKAIKNALGQTITKPQLPLALFIIVLLFLLVQNRIDRRDPKLAAAPNNAEPELTFGPIFRPGGASA